MADEMRPATSATSEVNRAALARYAMDDLADFIDVGVLGDKGDLLVLEKKRFDASQGVFILEVNRTPAKAGIDPLNKLIDRKPDDNLIRVEKRN